MVDRIGSGPWQKYFPRSGISTQGTNGGQTFLVACLHRPPAHFSFDLGRQGEPGGRRVAEGPMVSTGGGDSVVVVGCFEIWQTFAPMGIVLHPTNGRHSCRSFLAHSWPDGHALALPGSQGPPVNVAVLVLPMVAVVLLDFGF